jgi:hypothetical protein
MLLLGCFKGSPTKITCDLETFGIPTEQLPINFNTGTVKTQYLAKWINMRLARDEYMARADNKATAAVVASTECILDAKDSKHEPFPWIECPSQQDVLLGRGRPIMNHRGNVTMRELVGSKLSRFNAAIQKQGRTRIIEEVVMEIQECGGRFLREDPIMTGFWIEVDMITARRKVGIYFRDLRCSSGAQGLAAAGATHIDSSSSYRSSSTSSSRGATPPTSLSENWLSTSEPASDPSKSHVSRRSKRKTLDG